MKSLKNRKGITVIVDIIAVAIFLIGVINFHYGIEWLPTQVIDVFGHCLNLIPGFSGVVLFCKSKL